jgi:hypothetical protein
MAKSKREVDDIDEAAFLQSIYEQDNYSPSVVQPKTEEQPLEPVPEQIEKPKEAKEPVKRKRGTNNADYSSQFLGRNEIKAARQCVYISHRIHTMISEIVRVIADKEVSVGGYIDNVLLQHLETHKDEINDLYKRERKDLIEF